MGGFRCYIRSSDSNDTVETNCSWRFVVHAGVEVFLLLKGDFLKGLVMGLAENDSFLFLMLVDLYPKQCEANVLHGVLETLALFMNRRHILSRS